MPRWFRDRDFIETSEGLVFCVIGNVHPTSRVLSYLKYVRGYKSGIRVKWSRGGVEYGRILPFYSAVGVASTYEFLRSCCREFLVFDMYRSIELVEVPIERIYIHYLPEVRAKEILQNPADALEEHAKNLIEEISNASGVSVEAFGVTGSILLKIHNLQYSDVDLVVYGRQNALKVRETLKQLLDESKRGFSRPRGEELLKWASEIVRVHPLTVEEAVNYYSRVKWNRALFKGRQFSIHPVKTESEVDERWEDKIVKPVGLVKIRAVVVDSSESLFMPAVYEVDEVRVIEGATPPGRVLYVVSYEGLYMDVAEEGDVIEVYGKLEHVEDLRRGLDYYQVTVGTIEAGGRDYIKSPRFSAL